MFHDVQRRLTILYTTMTGLILAVLLACLFMWNINSKEQGETFAFHNLWLSMNTHVQMDTILGHSFLAQTEAAGRSIIYIEENGTPLLFPGAWTPDTPRAELVKRGFEAAEKEGISPSRPLISSSMEQTSLFKIKGDHGDSYFGRILLLSTENGVKCMLMLSYITPRSVLIGSILPLFFLLCTVGIISIFFVSRYLTARALNPARESAKKQVEFIAAASHELRSPLAVIRSGVSALQKSDGEDGGDFSNGAILKGGDNSDRILSSIDKECSRMARLVSDMLLLASTDARNWTLLKTEVNIDTLLIEAYEAFLPLCRCKRLELILALPEDSLPPLMADKQRLEQVLSILLDNAISYTPEGKRIVLAAYEKKNPYMGGAGGSRIIIEVQDTGEGISSDRKKQIFDRFYRGDASRNDKKHFGLGLSIAKELVELHGGTIMVLDNPGGGSRFLIRL